MQEGSKVAQSGKRASRWENALKFRENYSGRLCAEDGGLGLGFEREAGIPVVRSRDRGDA